MEYVRRCGRVGIGVVLHLLVDVLGRVSGGVGDVGVVLVVVVLVMGCNVVVVGVVVFVVVVPVVATCYPMPVETPLVGVHPFG